MKVPLDQVPLTFSLTNFYDVPLVCEAAPKIGCGCRTKPVLAALDLYETVQGAWLRRSGMTLAVQWHQWLTEEDAMGIVNAALAGEGKVAAIRDSVRVERLFQELSSGALWYSVATIDKLSSEEADLIAARIGLHRRNGGAQRLHTPSSKQRRPTWIRNPCSVGRLLAVGGLSAVAR